MGVLGNTEMCSQLKLIYPKRGYAISDHSELDDLSLCSNQVLDQEQPRVEGFQAAF